MSEMIYPHTSARRPHEPSQFLIIAHGMLFSEVTASSLLKVDLEGKVSYQPDLPYGLQLAGFVIHSAIYKARPDVGAVMHTHTVAGMAVSSLKCGLLPLTQTSMRFYGRIAYHDFTGPERDPGERERLAEHLGAQDIMILRNHCLLTVKPRIPETFHRMYGLSCSILSSSCSRASTAPTIPVRSMRCVVSTGGDGVSPSSPTISRKPSLRPCTARAFAASGSISPRRACTTPISRAGGLRRRPRASRRWTGTC